MNSRPGFGPTRPRASPTDRQVCLYAAEICSELRQLARRPRLRTLSYLLDMVRLEAEQMAKSLPD